MRSLDLSFFALILTCFYFQLYAYQQHEIFLNKESPELEDELDYEGIRNSPDPQPRGGRGGRSRSRSRGSGGGGGSIDSEAGKIVGIVIGAIGGFVALAVIFVLLCSFCRKSSTSDFQPTRDKIDSAYENYEMNNDAT